MSTSTVPKILRWHLRLQEYDFTVRHIPGVQNVTADCLSRLLTIQMPVQPTSLVTWHNSVQGHTGINDMERNLRQAGFHWHNMRSDISDFVNACPTCQKVKHASIKPPPCPTATISVTEPWSLVSVDTLGPLPVDNDGNKFIIAIIDNFTRFTVLQVSHVKVLVVL
jgi:hypothetical protein